MPIEKGRVGAYRIPTDAPESDGTLAWESTTLVTVEVEGEGQTGFGYTYNHHATAVLIDELLLPLVIGTSPFDVTRNFHKMVHVIRNLGRTGLVASAIAALDTALWDLKAKILNVPLVSLWGAVRESIPAYGSGGFTSYDLHRLRAQLGGWAGEGLQMVKMKIGTTPSQDLERVRAAREAIGPNTKLFVDANGAYAVKEALAFAEAFAELGVEWFEEPVSSDDLNGLKSLRERLPPGMALAAGEYGSDLFYFQRMLEAEAVDVLQADATRAMGLTGFLEVGALCDAVGRPLSAHTAPSIHLHLGCAVERVVHLEYFHDHVRIEELLFDGVRRPVNGRLTPDLSRPGLGVEFKAKDAQKFALARTYG
jgi:L-alanine-DL-glutamate epimerase-like enolase superfamily enzyme